MNRHVIKWESLIVLCFSVLLEASAASPSILYDGSLHSSPTQQGWLYLTQPLIGASAATSITNEATRLDSTGKIADKAGFFSTLPPFGNHPAVPVLDRTNGFRIAFEVSVLKETHASEHRSGFSVIVLSSDLRGIELEFWENEIWAQTDQPAFTHGEGKVFNTSAGRVSYALALHHESYQLTANGALLLEGPLRDYSSTGQPYTIPNFIFLGDNTGSAAATVELSFVSVELMSIGALLSGPRLQPDGFRAELLCQSGQKYGVDVSSDFKTWISLTNFVAAETSIEIFDPGATTVERRFYRAFQFPHSAGH